MIESTSILVTLVEMNWGIKNRNDKRSNFPLRRYDIIR